MIPSLHVGVIFERLIDIVVMYDCITSCWSDFRKIVTLRTPAGFKGDLAEDKVLILCELSTLLSRLSLCLSYTPGGSVVGDPS